MIYLQMKMRISETMWKKSIRNTELNITWKMRKRKKRSGVCGGSLLYRGNSIIDDPREECKRGGKLWYQQAH